MSRRRLALLPSAIRGPGADLGLRSLIFSHSHSDPLASLRTDVMRCRKPHRPLSHASDIYIYIYIMTLMLILEFHFSQNQLESVTKFCLLSATSCSPSHPIKAFLASPVSLREDCGKTLMQWEWLSLITGCSW